MSTNLATALDECLSAADPLAAAAQYPELEAELLPLIRTAQQVQETPKVVPSARGKAKGLELLLSAVRFKAQTRQAQQEVLAEAA